MTTEEKIALKLCVGLLQAAVDNGAEVIATACPLCQMNLEAYQDRINRAFDRNFKIPIVYFTHLVGVALGIPPAKMGLDKLLVSPEKALARAKEVRV